MPPTPTVEVVSGRIGEFVRHWWLGQALVVGSFDAGKVLPRLIDFRISKSWVTVGRPLAIFSMGFLSL